MLTTAVLFTGPALLPLRIAGSADQRAALVALNDRVVSISITTIVNGQSFIALAACAQYVIRVFVGLLGFITDQRSVNSCCPGSKILRCLLSSSRLVSSSAGSVLFFDLTSFLRALAIVAITLCTVARTTITNQPTSTGTGYSLAALSTNMPTSVLFAGPALLALRIAVSADQGTALVALNDKVVSTSIATIVNGHGFIAHAACAQYVIRFLNTLAYDRLRSFTSSASSCLSWRRRHRPRVRRL
jgi:hypothetical protein